jgi:StAR-related lipid transfer protein 10
VKGPLAPAAWASKNITSREKRLTIQIESRMARIAEDNDFDYLKKLVDDADGWILELDKADTRVWTRPIEGCSFQMVKIQTVFPDISSEILYDVLHDPDYRKVWDTHMLESLEIGLLNVNNDVGYYASKFSIAL